MAKGNKTFRLSIKTPLETILDEDVKSLIIDTEEGKMMVLPHHSALVGSISFSNIIIHMENNSTMKEFSVRNGFLSIDNDLNQTDVFCINCEKTQTLTYTSVEDYLKFLQNELGSDKLNPYQLEYLENEKFAVVKQLKTLKKSG